MTLTRLVFFIIATVALFSQVGKQGGIGPINGGGTAGGNPGASGAVTFIKNCTAANVATLNCTSFYNVLYDTYILELDSLIPASNGATLRARVSTDNGSTWNTGGLYSYANTYTITNGTTAGTGGSVQQQFEFGGGVSGGAGTGVSGEMTFLQLGSAVNAKALISSIEYIHTTANFLSMKSGGIWNNSTAVNGIQYYYDTGNITGTVRIFGRTKQ